MANRLLYSSQALFASPGISGASLSQLHRVLSINHGANVTRQDVTVFGSRAPIDRIIVEAPTVSMDVSYLVTNGHNENVIGLYVNPSGTPYGSGQGSGLLTNILNGTRDEQNYFIKVVDESQDADINATAPVGVIGFGNGSLTSYSLEARVGGFPTASARIAGLNIEYTMANATVNNPSINPVDGSPYGNTNTPATYTIPNAPTASLNDPVNAVRPGDIQLDLPALFALENGTICPQSFTLTIDMNREALRCLGTKFRYAYEINFPLTATFSMEVLVRDLQASRLADFLCTDSDVAGSFDIKLRSPNCANGTPGASTDANNLLVYSMKGARFDSITFNNGVGNGETATINYSVSIGGPNDTAHNIFLVSEVGNI